jgi:hypothetical protein
MLGEQGKLAHPARWLVSGMAANTRASQARQMFLAGSSADMLSPTPRLSVSADSKGDREIAPERRIVGVETRPPVFEGLVLACVFTVTDLDCALPLDGRLLAEEQVMKRL